jgi:hypothetical protein
MDYLLTLLADPAAWMALLTLVVMEVVLGIADRRRSGSARPQRVYLCFHGFLSVRRRIEYFQ